MTAKSDQRLRAVLIVACGAQFMVVLDSLIVTVALPAMKSDLGLSAAGQQWIVNSYLITFGGLLLFAARIADLLGHRRVFVAGLVVFSLASLIGGLATDGWLLLVARAAQGVGAAALAPTSLSLLTVTHTEPRQRTHALSIWGATSGSAAALGLVLGGLLTDLGGWRWVLLINVPFGAALLVAATRSLPPTPAADRARLDLPGAMTVTFGIGSLVYGISQVTEFGWASTRVAGALLVSALLLLLFVRVEGRSRTPLIPLAIFARRNIAVANTIMACLGAIMTATLFFLALYHQQVLGYSPTRTGLALLPMSIVIVAGSVASKTLVPVFGARTLIVGGAVVTTAALLWMARLPAQAHYPTHVLGPTLIWACGIGVMSVPIAITATRDIEPDLAGLASGLLNTARQVGGAIGLAALATVASVITAGAHNNTTPQALVHGYNTALTIAAGIALITAALAMLTPTATPRPTTERESADDTTS